MATLCCLSVSVVSCVLCRVGGRIVVWVLYGRATCAVGCGLNEALVRCYVAVIAPRDERCQLAPVFADSLKRPAHHAER